MLRDIVLCVNEIVLVSLHPVVWVHAVLLVCGILWLVLNTPPHEYVTHDFCPVDECHHVQIPGVCRSMVIREIDVRWNCRIGAFALWYFAFALINCAIGTEAKPKRIVTALNDVARAWCAGSPWFCAWFVATAVVVQIGWNTETPAGAGLTLFLAPPFFAVALLQVANRVL